MPQPPKDKPEKGEESDKFSHTLRGLVGTPKKEVEAQDKKNKRHRKTKKS